MRVLQRCLRPAAALLVIAHGLAHSVLPLRGWMNPGMLGRNFMPLILYTVAVLGFTTAGIGSQPCTGSSERRYRECPTRCGVAMVGPPGKCASA